MTTQATETPSMFRLELDPTFWWPVKLTVPGKAEPVTVEMEFKHHDRDEMKAYWEAAPKRTDLENVAAIVRNWRNVDTAFSQDALARLVTKYNPAAKEIYDAFQSGQLVSRAKN